MCLILFAYDPQSDHPLVVAANRDEFYARPATSAHFWEDRPRLLAGRDLSAGGTWLGISRDGRFAAVTNFAEEGPSEAPLSRGRLPEAFLSSRAGSHHFAHHVDGQRYRGFNLLMWDTTALVYTSNRGHTQDLPPGIYGLANAELGAAWPKVARGRQALQRVMQAGPEPEVLLALLRDATVPPDSELPRRGRPLELERRVAPCFIAGEEYGTRASTVVIFEHARGCEPRARFVEQQYGPGGEPGHRSSFELAVE